MVISAVEIFRKIWNHRLQIVSFFLCLVILFTCSLVVPFTHAHAGPEIALAPALIEEAAQILIILGITVTSYLLIKQWLGTVQTEDPDLYDQLIFFYEDVYGYPDSNGKAPKDGGDISLNAGTAAILQKMYESAKEYFNQKQGTKTVPDYSSVITSFSDLIVEDYQVAMTNEQIYNLARYSYNDVCTLSNGTRTDVYTTTSYEASGSTQWVFTRNDSYYSMLGALLEPPKFGFMIGNYNDVVWLYPYVTYKYSNYGQTAYQVVKFDEYQPPYIVTISPDELTVAYPDVELPYTNNPEISPATIIGTIGTSVNPIQFPYTLINDDPDDDTQRGALIDTGIIPDTSATENPNPSPETSEDPLVDPDSQYKPAITELPDIGGIWDYVRNFMSNALIWMLLWFNGFNMLPVEIRYMIYGILVIIIVTGLLGVFLK